ncbi:MAG: sigma-70 family RNA polymerase sigma factor [Gemmatimonadetes bacterium]|nr:sigma-70 family RNA polymerase sigma factor [Gemmatimonadota bacterium]
MNPMTQCAHSEKRDEDIVRAVLNGDVEQYALLIQRYQQVLWAMALSRLRDHRQARESVHDAFVNAYLSLHTLNRKERFGAWLRTILYNCCLKTLKKKSRETALPEQALDASPNPQDRLESQEAGENLWQALASLSPLFREPVLLHYFFAFSVEDIAAWLDIPTGTVKRRLHAARKQLKQHLLPLSSNLDIHLEKEIVMEIKDKKIPGAVLEYVDMSEAVFRNIDLSGADFEYVNIDRTRFRNTGGGDHTPAKNITFEHCTMQESHFAHVDLSGSHFQHVNLSNVTLENCPIEGLTIDGFDIKALIEKEKDG